MTLMTRRSTEVYQALVYGDDGFVTFFEQMTPIREISELKLGSRPARRTTSHRIEDLRAIPWVFSWTQARVLLPGWYGLGSALEAGIDRYGLDYLQEMDKDWPYFAAVLSNAELALAKATCGLALNILRWSIRTSYGHGSVDDHRRIRPDRPTPAGDHGQQARSTASQCSNARSPGGNPYVDPLFVHFRSSCSTASATMARSKNSCAQCCSASTASPVRLKEHRIRMQKVQPPETAHSFRRGL